MNRVVLPVGVRCLMGASVLMSCGTTSMLKSWSDPAYTGGKMRRVLVIGVGRNASLRKQFEDAFVARLARSGIQAQPSYPLLPDAAAIRKETVVPHVVQRAVTHVLVARVVDHKTVAEYVPPTVTSTYVPAYPSYYYGWHSYYDMSYAAVVSPGYTYETEYVHVETNVYDVGTEKLIWSGLTETELGGRAEAKIQEFIDAITSYMSQAKLI